MLSVSESQRKYLRRMKPGLAKEFAKKIPKEIKLPQRLDNPRTKEEREIRQQMKYGR